MLKTKLLTEDLERLKESAEIQVTEHIQVGDVKLEGTFFVADLLLPSNITPETKPALWFKHKEYDKFRFYFNQEGIQQIKQQITQTGQFSNSFVLVEDEYQVSIDDNIVMYLNEQEIGEMAAIFSKLTTYL